MNPRDAIPQDRFRPVTWTVWLLWTLLAAVEPVLSTVEATLFNANYPNSAPYAKWMPTLVVFSLLATWLTPPILQGFIVRRCAPKLSVWFWLGCVLLTGVAWFTFKQGGNGADALSDVFRTVQHFRSAVLTERLAGTLSFTHLLALPWGPLLTWTVVGSAATAILPALAIGIATGERRIALAFFGAAIVAGCVAAVVDELYNIYAYVPAPLHDWALNNRSWPDRFQVLAIRAGVGAVWGATGALVVALLTRRLVTSGARLLAPQRPAGLMLMAAMPVAIVFLAPFAGYLAGPQGLRAGAPAMWKSLSSAPSGDQPQGEPVLTYSHDLAATLGRILSLTFSPDSKIAIVRNTEHKLVRIDLKSGRDLGALTEALLPLEQHAVLFSPDGRYLAIESSGEAVSVGRYTRHQIRVRLFALPDFTPAGEFSNRDGQCFDGASREPMLFEADNNSLWLACAPYNAPKADDIMAIRIAVPSMQVLDTRHYGEMADSGMVRGLERVGGSVWAWQFPYGAAVPFRIRDLSNDREVLTLHIPAEPVANLTAQIGQSRVDDKTIKLNFCGVHSTAPDAAGHFDPAASLCRFLTFDTHTGVLIEQADRSDHRFAKAPSAMLTGHGLRVETTWPPDSKTGEIIVRDVDSGAERQRIVTAAQRPLQFSPDGRWLVMVSTDSHALRAYRIKP